MNDSGVFSSTVQQVKRVTPLDPDATMPFVGQALKTLRQEVRNLHSQRLTYTSVLLPFMPCICARCMNMSTAIRIHCSKQLALEVVDWF
jgi:hypothetical protein